jgi:hypothetical protein
MGTLQIKSRSDGIKIRVGCVLIASMPLSALAFDPYCPWLAAMVASPQLSNCGIDDAADMLNNFTPISPKVTGRWA